MREILVIQLLLFLMCRMCSFYLETGAQLPTRETRTYPVAADPTQKVGELDSELPPPYSPSMSNDRKKVIVEQV